MRRLGERPRGSTAAARCREQQMRLPVLCQSPSTLPLLLQATKAQAHAAAQGHKAQQAHRRVCAHIPRR